MKTDDILNLGLLGMAVLFGYKAYDKFFGDNAQNDNLTPSQERDFSEQTLRFAHTEYPKQEYPESNWSPTFNFTDIEQSELTPTDTNIRTTDTEGNLTTYKFNPDDLTAPQRRAFNYGLWDFEDGNLQFGIFEGIQRKLRGGLGEDTLFTTQPTTRDFFDSSSTLQQTDLFINTSKAILGDKSVFNQTPTPTPTPTHSQRRGGGSSVRDTVTVTPITNEERTVAKERAERFGSDKFRELAERLL